MTGNRSAGVYAIDLKWYDANRRSFAVLVRPCLCSTHRRLGAEHSVEHILKTVRDCCARSPAFLSRKLPVLETAFRLFLADGNRPMPLEEIEQKLVRLRGRSSCPPLPILARLLESDSYYGIRRVDTG